MCLPTLCAVFMLCSCFIKTFGLGVLTKTDGELEKDLFGLINLIETREEK